MFSFELLVGAARLLELIDLALPGGVDSNYPKAQPPHVEAVSDAVDLPFADELLELFFALGWVDDVLVKVQERELGYDTGANLYIWYVSDIMWCLLYAKIPTFTGQTLSTN